MRVNVDGSIDGESVIIPRGVSESQRRAFAATIQPERTAEAVSRVLSAHGERGTGTLSFSDPHNLRTPFLLSSKFHLVDAVELSGPGATTIPIGFALGAMNEVARSIPAEGRHLPFPCWSGSIRDEYTVEFPPAVRIAAIPKDVEYSSGPLGL